MNTDDNNLSETHHTDTPVVEGAGSDLQYDFDKFLDGELESINRERNSAFVFVKLPDGTEEQFYVTERVLRKGNYYLDTKPGTKMRVKLIKDYRRNGQISIGMIERNPYVPPRPDARSLPWLPAKVTKERESDKDFMFVTIQQSCDLFNAPADIYVPMRLLRNLGYVNGLELGQELNVRIICGERGLIVVSIETP